MRFSVRWLAATAIVAAMNFGQSAAASTNVNIYNYTSSDSFSLILYKIDDTMTVSISNNNLNNYDIAIQSFGNGPYNFDFSSDVTSGINDINFSLLNTDAGYTLGWNILYNGNSIATYSCGVFNTTGCNNSDLTLGIVYNTDVLLNVSSSPAPIPEPTSMMMLGTGIMSIVGARWRTNKKRKQSV